MPEPDSITDNNKFIDQLNIIKTKLNVSISQLSELFCVSPKIIYDWYDEITVPFTEILQRTEILILSLETVPPDANLHRLKHIWKIPVSNQSFLSTFQTTPIDILQTQLIDKLHELNVWLLVVNQKSLNPKFQLSGNAHLAEFDHIMDFN